ncbi:MAG: hypothetical protein NC254_04490 [bacterium]|nr:hypothetical protein [bacterium]
MGNIESILLTYDNPERVDYQFFAEFLRLAGIYVCEDCRTEAAKNVRWDEGIFSAVYVIEKQATHAGKLNRRRKVSKLNSLADNLHSQTGASAFYDCWYDIAKVYLTYDLLQAGVTMQYFRTKVPTKNKATIRKVGDLFERAADAFVRLVKENPWYMNNQYIRYAKLYCKQKANLARYFCGEPVVYYVDDLGAEGMALLQRFPEFSNAWALLGFVYEISADHVKDTVDAFQRAIQMEGAKPYVSSIYYWLGKRCEEYSYLRTQVYDFYEKAYRLMPKYRNVYKVANWYMQKKDWKNAILYYQNCLTFLDARGDYQDPLEQEYCFKVNIHICYCFMQQKEYAAAIPYAEKALWLRQKLEQALENKGKPGSLTRFYYDMYNAEHAEACIAIELDRMQDAQVNTYLAKAYQEINKPEEAKRYLDQVLPE